jgi:DNA-directed RNA polymerase specialized sigma24 family protein
MRRTATIKVILREGKHTLQALLHALPQRQRRILAMRYVGEITQAEIAAQVGCRNCTLTPAAARVDAAAHRHARRLAVALEALGTRPSRGRHR